MISIEHEIGQELTVKELVDGFAKLKDIVSSACTIAVIRNCLGTLESIHNFFIYPKRQNALQDAINEDETLRESRLKKLKKYCKTKWVEQHESVATYLHLKPAVIRALDVISTTWKDPTTSSGAFQLLSAIKTANFQISMHILSSVHSLTLSLSRVLQSKKPGSWRGYRIS
ncbi:uncharacterized protein LOC112687079 [Sipha flava]|uniref:Uncharacterized protein LOC112687079 n=1 Tax=Sipha flava TaxID=143950 RepID=A0A8B8FWQ1_9HEMI|nr:uncharacterized protein LOC112687079 [Sipha flava]